MQVQVRNAAVDKTSQRDGTMFQTFNTYLSFFMFLELFHHCLVFILNLFHIWVTPQFHLCNYLWNNSVHQAAHLICILASLSILCFVFVQWWTLNTCLVFLCVIESGQSVGSLFQLYFFWTTEEANHHFLFALSTTWQTSRDGIILFRDGLNIGGHLPCAVKEALAGAAAFSCTIWIKPKSRGALPVRLALPPIITAKKYDTS